MQLSEFVEKALTQIVQGVSAAAVEAAKLGGSVNPAPSSIGAGEQWTRDGGANYFRIINVRFDIALTTVDQAGKTAGVGVLSGVLNVGAKGESSTSDTSASRVQFDVPISLPRVKAPG